MARVILASASPRRQEILKQIGIEAEVIPSTTDEVSQQTEPAAYVEELSSIKAQDVAGQVEGDFVIIAADTVVAVDGTVLGKPANEDEAVQMITSLQGKRHEVYTGVTLITVVGGEGLIDTFHSRTIVDLLPMTPEQIDAYVKSGESMDKAGGYAIQGRFAPYISGIAGDFYNVMGMPISMVIDRLSQMGTVLI